MEIVDVRHRYPPFGAGDYTRNFAWLKGIAAHHDGVLMPPGDTDYSGSTLNEDLTRLDIIYSHAKAQGWGRFPYHFVASPNGRTLYTNDVAHWGAHVASRNFELLGIALMGDFTSSLPAATQLCAAARAIIAIWLLTNALPPMRAHYEWALPAYPSTCPGPLWPMWKLLLLDFTKRLHGILFP